MNKKNIIIGLAGLIILIGLLPIFILKGTGNQEESPHRDNTLLLAKTYFEQQEFQEAMKLLNGLLIADNSDEEAKELLSEILLAKKKYEEELAIDGTVNESIQEKQDRDQQEKADEPQQQGEDGD